MTTVRAASGLDEVADLWIALASHHYEAGAALASMAAPVGAAESWPARRGQYASWSREPGWQLLVADDNGTVSGYAAARVTPSSSAWNFGAHVGRLETLAVLPSARGRGLGTALLDAVRAGWRDAGIEFATVSVIAGNDGAQRFYDRLGAVEFTRTSVFPV
ncbi:GNAT family N-acetyltransferase [Actinoplanes sp. NPDC051411]|uniref:GNAT family N-acetyltransferase n=1 Tax=Actinoplanes sp. NPDC051411 TaxID=3155522 RepID=UPI00344112C2